MTYKNLIVQAIIDLNEPRKGSSQIAIKKHCEEHFYTQFDIQKSSFKKDQFNKALKRLTDENNLVQNKMSFKLSADYKKSMAKAAKGGGKNAAGAKKVRTRRNYLLFSLLVHASSSHFTCIFNLSSEWFGRKIPK